ncbi:MAG: sigma-54 dependent transcriptional regulator [Acidobacteriota bacterium]|jgi:DNA-binding NtrC family response regulator
MAPSASGGSSVLLLEDDLTLSALLEKFFDQWGWTVQSAGTVGEAQKMIAENTFDLVLSDYLLPDDNGLAIFDEIQKRSPLTKVMLMTGVQDMGVAASAFRKGAADLLPKPFRIQELEERIAAVMQRRTRSDDIVTQSLTEEVDWPRGIVGESLAIKKLVRLVKMVAKKDPPVMVTGESGTGKELVARAIHELSPRGDKTFVAINCGAIPENLLEDELFGHVRGAYTDAKSTRIGKLEEANGGTIFFDEIGEMKPTLQVKLLRVLEEHCFQRLGSNQSISVDFRVISATNADLRQRIEDGEFREDLFYRLNVVPIHVPPLRERASDIPLLANHFLDLFARQYGESRKSLEPESLKAICQHAWPGNIRELRNVIELGFILSGERESIRAEDLPTLDDQVGASVHGRQLDALLHLPEEGIDLNQVVSEVERNLICQSLERTGGNKGKAARLLFLKRTTLVEKLRRMNLLHEHS